MLLTPEQKSPKSNFGAHLVGERIKKAGVAAGQAEGEGEMISKRATKPATHSDLNREFEGRERMEWSWFFTALIVFTIIDGLNLRSWG
jgi:hypothetical protein